MKKIPLGLLIIFVAIAIFFYKFLLFGKLPIPSDTITGLYHPFRDYYSTAYPNGMPFKNFLITDPVRQQYPWRFEGIENLKNLQLPLWNPYNFSGTPLLANFQTGALYPLNILFLFLPFQIAWSFLILLQPLLAGLFIYLFLRHKKLDPVACAISGIAFAFSGFSISWMEWNTVVQVAIWLPLILLAKDHLLERFSFKWVIILIFAETSAILAGHLQILFYLWTVSISYLFVRILLLSWEKKDYLKTSKNLLKRTLPFLPLVIFIIFITLIQWIPTFAFIKESAREIDQINWQKEGWFIPWEHLLQFIVPDFFGNPTTLNYWGTWNYAEMVGYIGIVPLLLAIFALIFRRDKYTIYFGVVFLFSILFAFPTFLARLPFELRIPFLSTSQPTRLLFLTDFCLSILSGFGADYLIKKHKTLAVPIVFMGAILVTLWIITIGKFEISEKFIENILVVKSNLVVPSVIFIITVIVVILSSILKKHIPQKMLVIALLLITILDLLRFGSKFTPFTNPNYLYPSTKVTDFLKSQTGQFRVMSTDSQILPPNFSIIYHIQTLDGYDPLYLRRYGELTAMTESDKGRVPGALAFNRIITPHNYSSKLINLLNVKYVLSFNNISSKRFNLVLKEGKTSVYENKEVLPRAFFVSNIIIANRKEDTAAELFSSSFDPVTTAVVEDANGINKNYKKSSAVISDYSDNTVTIDTNTNSSGFLVLTDSYYPTWTVKLIDVSGKVKAGKIYRTNYNFRGVVVPADTKKVVFTDKLF